MPNTKEGKAIRQEDRISTWAIASDADNILHSRIQSYLFAQTFLVLAYATLLTVGVDSTAILHARAMACLVAVLGFAISWYTRRRLRSILNKLRYLMESKLVRDENYQDFITQGGTVDVDFATRNEFVDHIPFIIQSFWVIALVLTVVLTTHDLVTPS